MNDRSLLEQRTVALAGVAQAARIVDLAAKTGSWPLPYLPSSAAHTFLTSFSVICCKSKLC